MKMNWRGSGRGLFCGIIPAFTWRDWSRKVLWGYPPVSWPKYRSPLQASCWVKTFAIISWFVIRHFVLHWTVSVMEKLFNTQDSSVDIAAELTAGIRFPAEARNFHLLCRSISALTPTWPRLHWVPRLLFMGVTTSRAWSCPLTWDQNYGAILYVHSPMHLHGVMHD
jgi:hypothetical protein